MGSDLRGPDINPGIDHQHLIHDTYYMIHRSFPDIIGEKTRVTVGFPIKFPISMKSNQTKTSSGARRPDEAIIYATRVSSSD